MARPSTSSARRIMACGVGVFCITGVAAALIMSGKDYESLPPDPAIIQEQIEQSGADLARAVTAAERELKGKAMQASLDINAGTPTATVTVYAGGKANKVVVNAATGEVTSKQEVPRFPGEPMTGEWTETSSGLKYYDIKVGEGEMPAGPTSRVTVHYTGWLNDGMKFHSSVDDGKPATFMLGQVIPGWVEGVGSMKVGGKRKLLIPHALAYGESGRPPVIPPRATLFFEIELLDVE